MPKKIVTIEHAVSSSVGRLAGSVATVASDPFADWFADGWGYLKIDWDEDVEVTRLGCLINNVEPTETYHLSNFFDAMRPGFKPDHQEGWAWTSFFTCTCGHGGCSGYHDNVRINRKKKTVRVAGKRRHGYINGVVGTGDQVVYFDKGQWDGLLEEYLNLFCQNPHAIFRDNSFLFTGALGLELWSK